MSETAPTPAESADAASPAPTPAQGKPVPKKRAATRIDDAVRVAKDAGPAARRDLFEMLDSPHAQVRGEATYAAAKARADAIVREARHIRDFAREIDGLDAAQRAMVRAGVEAYLGS